MAKKVFTAIGTVFAGSLFFMSLILIVLGIVSARKNKIVSLFNYAFAVVVTDSMEPTIPTRSIIIIKKTPFRDVQEKDIIVYYSELHRFYIVHRVYEKLPDGSCRTKGDRAPAVDQETVTADNYFGKVVRYGNYLRYVYILIISSLMAIIVIETAAVIRKAVKKNKQEVIKKYGKK